MSGVVDTNLQPSQMSQASVSAAPDAVEKHRRYRAMIERIREVAGRALPAGSSVLVVSKGDDDLLRLGNCTALHFPQQEGGGYSGFYPMTGTDAVEHLEKLRSRGAEFILFPATAFWWLTHYAELGDHLSSHYRTVAFEDETCVVYAPRESSEAASDPTPEREPDTPDRRSSQMADFVEALLPSDAVVLVLTENGVESRGGQWRMSLGGTRDEVGSVGVGHLELTDLGADFLVVPASLRQRLNGRGRNAVLLSDDHRVVTEQEHVCTIYHLRHSDPESGGRADDVRDQLAAAARMLFPPGSRVAVAGPLPEGLLPADIAISPFPPLGPQVPGEEFPVARRLRELHERGVEYLLVTEGDERSLTGQELRRALEQHCTVPWSDGYSTVFYLDPSRMT